MTFSLYRATKSCRLTVRTPEGQVARVENLSGGTGFSMKFEARRSMDAGLGEFSATVYNLPPDLIGTIESAQPRRMDDADQLLAGVLLQSGEVLANGDDGIEAGFCVVEMEAGYDGQMGRIFRAVGARIASDPVDGDTTIETTITAVESLDGVLLGLPLRTFPAGTPTYDALDYLRHIAGLGPGNLTPASLAAILGESRLDSPYHVSGGQAIGRIEEMLKYLNIRWFTDDREFWICGRDNVPNAGNVPPYLADPPVELAPILGRPRRADGGRVQVQCLLSPQVLPGRLVRLTEAGLALALQGLSPTIAQVIRARVPPSLYRADEVRHSGDTESEAWTTTVLLRQVLA